MECHVLKCEWLDGRPDSGHLQEAARNARFFFLLPASFVKGSSVMRSVAMY